MQIKQPQIVASLAIAIISILIIAIFLLATQPGKDFLISIGVASESRESQLFDYEPRSLEFAEDQTAKDAIQNLDGEISKTVNSLEVDLDVAFEDFDEEVEFGI